MRTTVIYYSSNRENEAFERKIIDNIVKQAGDLPIISVTQKPCSLGENVCVGEHEASVYNSKKQIYEGLKLATTEFVTMAEADFLYPKSYFDFEPQEDVFYCMKNIHILWTGKNKVWRKFGSEGAMVCHRKKLMEYMETYLDGWDAPRPAKMISILFHPDKRWVWTDDPIVTFKTGNGMNRRCPYFRKKTATELPIWGSVQEIKSEFLSVR